MCGAIFADETAAIQGKRNGQAAFCDLTNIVQNLVVGALHKRRINRDNRPQTAQRHARSKSDGVFFDHADIKAAIWKLFDEFINASSARHGRCNRHDARVFFGECNERIRKNLRVSWQALWFWIRRFALWARF